MLVTVLVVVVVISGSDVVLIELVNAEAVVCGVVVLVVNVGHVLVVRIVDVDVDTIAVV